MENFRNTKADFQPSRSRRGIISGTTLTFDDGKVINASTDSSGQQYFKLEHAATLFLNTPGNIRVTPLNNGNGYKNSILFQSVQGDFHRIIKYIWITDTINLDIVFDERSYLNLK